MGWKEGRSRKGGRWGYCGSLYGGLKRMVPGPLLLLGRGGGMSGWVCLYWGRLGRLADGGD